MNALEDCCRTCACGRVWCREDDDGCPDCAQLGCGRIDDHAPHEWTLPTHLEGGYGAAIETVPPTPYTCYGAPVIEGGALSELEETA